jgi:hypothetical protein
MDIQKITLKTFTLKIPHIVNITGVKEVEIPLKFTLNEL